MRQRDFPTRKSAFRPRNTRSQANAACDRQRLPARAALNMPATKANTVVRVHNSLRADGNESHCESQLRHEVSGLITKSKSHSLSENALQARTIAQLNQSLRIRHSESSFSQAFSGNRRAKFPKNCVKIKKQKLRNAGEIPQENAEVRTARRSSVLFHCRVRIVSLAQPPQH